jgi:SNF2 family DNA or RNA helicase
MQTLPEMIDEGRRVLVFSQFTSMLSLIEDELKKHKIKYVKLTGETKNRQDLVDRFQTGEIPVFLISLRAGGVGLNLTAADTVIHFDPWWNPAVENQATDRAYRIGQDKPVFVYKLIIENSIEERIQQIQINKAELANALLSEEVNQGKLSLTDDILKALLAPLV